MRAKPDSASRIAESRRRKEAGLSTICLSFDPHHYFEDEFPIVILKALNPYGTAPRGLDAAQIYEMWGSDGQEDNYYKRFSGLLDSNVGELQLYGVLTCAEPGQSSNVKGDFQRIAFIAYPCEGEDGQRTGHSNSDMYKLLVQADAFPSGKEPEDPTVELHRYQSLGYGPSLREFRTNGTGARAWNRHHDPENLVQQNAEEREEFRLDNAAWKQRLNSRSEERLEPPYHPTRLQRDMPKPSRKLDDDDDGSLFAYEGIVLPGRNVMMGRWWVIEDEDGDRLRCGPFIYWNVTLGFSYHAE